MKSKYKNLLSRINIMININIIKGVKNAFIELQNNSSSEESKNKKIVFKDLVKTDFQSLNTGIEGHYEERLYKDKNHPNQSDNRFLHKKDRVKIEDILKKTNKIALLGNAGIGKTTELKSIFNFAWKKRFIDNRYPLYIDLKSFRQTTKLDDLIVYSNWKKLPKLFLILDGLDEVSDIQDVVSEIENFIVQNKELDINYIISCRTNIYEKYLINLNEFKVYYLSTLTYKQSDNILKNNYDIHLTYEDLHIYRDYIENPFHIKLFANYFKERKQFPKSTAEMWNLIIKDEINRLFINKTKKRNKGIDLTSLNLFLEKLCITNELCQKNIISDEECSKILNPNEKKLFQELPFIDKYSGNNNYFFRHRNYQEFFAAKYISKLNPEKIVQLIKIEGTERTKPSLLNVLSILLNILEVDKRKTLVNWLLKNELEVLFLLEAEKIDETLRNNIFKSYFENICIEKTFWINNTNNIKLKNLSEFANYDFLLSIIQDNKQIFRTIISAFDVLISKNLNSIQLSKLKNVTLKILSKRNLDSTKSLKSDNQIKESILTKVQYQKLHLNDELYFETAFRLLYRSKNLDIFKRFISMVADFENPDKYSNLILRKSDCLYSHKREVELLSPSADFSDSLLKITAKSNNKENFISFLRYIIDSDYGIYDKVFDKYDKKHLNNILKKHQYFFKKYGNEYLTKILDLFLSINLFYTEKGLFDLFINSTNSEECSFEYIFSKQLFNNKSYQLLIRLCTKPSIDFIVDSYNKEQYDENTIKDFERFRNHLFYRTTDEDEKNNLGKYFNDKFIKAGLKFEKKLPAYEEFHFEEEQNKIIRNQNFELVFDLKLLLKKIKDIYIKSNKDRLSFDEVFDMQKKWYREGGYHNMINTVFDTILTFLRAESKEPITYSKIESFLKLDYNYLTLINNNLSQRNKPLNLKKEHIDVINTLCISLINQLENNDYKNVIKVNKEDGYKYEYYPNLNIISLLYRIDTKLEGVKFPQSFYESTLCFCGAISIHSDNNIFEHIESNIDSKYRLKELVIKNLKSLNLDYQSLKLHSNYAVDKNLTEVFSIIEDLLITLDSFYYPNKLLEKYIKSINYDNSFLKRCYTQNDSVICWEAIDIYFRQYKIGNLINEVTEIAIAYLEKESRGDRARDFKAKLSLEILFYTNKNYALEFYWNNLSENTYRKDFEAPYILCFQQYKHFNELDYLEKIFNVVYKDDDKYRDFNSSIQFLTKIICHLATIDYKVIYNFLIKLKSDISKNNDTKMKTKTFYINNILDSAEDAYYQSLVRKLTFDEAKKIVFEIQ
ncbi:NACHT domain-containing NTPase [Mesonia sp. K7]|uniref:NACHT domain-containing protein n=1 Tax=Mesonia sp. K7 TaxID=2218606 RepID=UPI0011B46BE8|nr:hypothetical protein [Mesonia sp. K7]